ncbi:hypothetical protein [Sorangium sp. So ce385]|uniref:hypothetical protein n=1 Tax=Sorangium sp. So ce385 TaxID=3133308 RepID=UPI003F5AF0C2
MQMKYLLAQMAIQDPGRLFATFGPGGDAALLKDLWTAVGQSLPAGERISSAGARTWHRPAGQGPEVLVLALPPAIHRNEAYFVGAARLPGGACRVFCLERTIAPVTGAEGTVLAELAAEGRSNWGPGSVPLIEEFAELVSQVVSDASASPLTFIPMRLG